MPNRTPGAAIVVTAAHIRGFTVAAGGAMTAVGVGGLALHLFVEEDLEGFHFVYISALLGLMFLGLMTMVVATLRGHAAVIRHQAYVDRATRAQIDALEQHQARIEDALTAHFQKIERMIDEKTDHVVQRRIDQLGELLAAVYDTTQLQATIIGDVIEKKLGVNTDDEFTRRRRERRGV